MQKKRKPVVNLLGVTHVSGEADKVLKAILSRIKPGQAVGLEATPDDLKEFERIRRLQERSKVSFEEAYQGRSLAISREVVKGVLPKVLLDRYPEKLWKEGSIEFTGVKFFFLLYSALKERGFKVRPLESQAAMRKSLQYDYKLHLLKGLGASKAQVERLRRLNDLIRLPVRERFMARQLASPPAFVVVGSAHLPGIRKALEAKGFKARTVADFRARRSLSFSRLEGLVIRELYLARRKQRQERPEKALKKRLKGVRRGKGRLSLVVRAEAA